MIDDNRLTDSAVTRIDEIIYNDEMCREITEYNFKLGKRYFPYKVLEEKLTELFHAAW